MRSKDITACFTHNSLSGFGFGFLKKGNRGEVFGPSRLCQSLCFSLIPFFFCYFFQMTLIVVMVGWQSRDHRTCPANLGLFFFFFLFLKKADDRNAKKTVDWMQREAAGLSSQPCRQSLGEMAAEPEMPRA